MDEVYIPQEALDAARYAVSCSWRPTEDTIDERVPSLMQAYERRWPHAVWRAAIKKALSMAPKQAEPPIWMPEFRFFYHDGSDSYVALLASEIDFLPSTDMFLELDEVPAYRLSDEDRRDLINQSLDHYIKEFGL